MNSRVPVRTSVLFLIAVSIASAGKMIQPAAVASGHPVDPFANMGVVGGLGSTIDQSGLDTSYVPFETEFDEFTDSAKASSTATPPSLGGVGPGLPAAFDFDLGGIYRIDAIAIWNQAGGEGSSALREFDLLTSLTPDFTDATFVGSFSLPVWTEGNPVPADVFTFTNVPTRYVRILATSNRGSTDATRINEFAVRRATLFTPSPGDEQISFLRYDPDDGQELYTINADGTGEKSIRGAADYVAPPRWSPDGTRLAFTVDPYETSGEPDRETDVYTIESDGSGDSQLTNRVEDDNYPFWSPDGSQLAFESERDSDGVPGIYVMDADGSNVVGPLAPGRYPHWSPNGLTCPQELYHFLS